MTRRVSAATGVVVAALYAMVAMTSMRPVLDRDMWWHLRTGQWIAEHHTVPRVDPFVLSGAAKSWIASSWLFDSFLHLLYRTFGLAGFGVYRLLLGSAVLVGLQWLTTRSRTGPFVAILLPALAMAGMAPILTPRPDLFSILLYTVEIAVLFSALEETGHRRRLWLLPPLFVLWANLHIDFVYGLLVLGLATVAQRIDRRVHGASHLPDATPRLATITIVCALATLLTPYHVTLYSAVFDRGGQAPAFDALDDLLSLQFRQAADWIVLGLGLGAAALTGRRTRHQTFMVLLIALSAFVSFRSNRDAWMLAVSAVAILSWPASADPGEVPARSVNWRHGGAIALVVLAVVGALVWSRAPHEPRWQAVATAQLPIAAAQAVEARRYPGPVYTPLFWGGYLLWRLPSLSIAIDGRLNLHGDDRVRRSLATWSGEREWSSDPELAVAGTVVAPKDSSLTALLHDDRRFGVVYNDEVAVVFVAKRATHRAGQDATGRPPTTEETP